MTVNEWIRIEKVFNRFVQNFKACAVENERKTETSMRAVTDQKVRAHHKGLMETGVRQKVRNPTNVWLVTVNEAPTLIRTYVKKKKNQAESGFNPEEPLGSCLTLPFIFPFIINPLISPVQLDTLIPI